MAEWIDSNGLSLRNPPHVPTWLGFTDTDTPSILDLAFANMAMEIMRQLGEIEISHKESLESDHTALILNIYPINSLAIIPLPAPKGYQADPERRDSWVKEFVMSLPLCLPYALEHSTAPVDPSVICRGVMAQESLNSLNTMIKEASRKTLEPKCVLDPRGVDWWNDACSVAHTLAHTASPCKE
jgi:hypothetical protein